MLHKIIKLIYGIILITMLSQYTFAESIPVSEVFSKYKVNDTSTNSTNNELSYVNALPDSDYKSFIIQIIKLILQISGMLCFISISVSGVMFIIPDSGSQGEAKKVLTYSLYGILTIALAYSVVYGISQINLN